MNKFCVNGSTVSVYRYSVTGSCDGLSDVTSFADTAEAAQEIAERLTDAVINTVDYSDVAWMDSIVVPKSSDPYAEAVKIYEMGEAAYKAQCALAEKSKNEQLRADLDYVMLMGGL